MDWNNYSRPNDFDWTSTIRKRPTKLRIGKRPTGRRQQKADDEGRITGRPDFTFNRFSNSYFRLRDDQTLDASPPSPLLIRTVARAETSNFETNKASYLTKQRFLMNVGKQQVRVFKKMYTFAELMSKGSTRQLQKALESLLGMDLTPERQEMINQLQKKISRGNEGVRTQQNRLLESRRSGPKTKTTTRSKQTKVREMRQYQAIIDRQPSAMQQWIQSTIARFDTTTLITMSHDGEMTRYPDPFKQQVDVKRQYSMFSRTAWAVAFGAEREHVTLQRPNIGAANHLMARINVAFFTNLTTGEKRVSLLDLEPEAFPDIPDEYPLDPIEYDVIKTSFRNYGQNKIDTKYPLAGGLYEQGWRKEVSKEGVPVIYIAKDPDSGNFVLRKDFIRGKSYDPVDRDGVMSYWRNKR